MNEITNDEQVREDQLPQKDVGGYPTAVPSTAEPSEAQEEPLVQVVI
jgi:hypothetical protein